jgi:hypothetical protein
LGLRHQYRTLGRIFKMHWRSLLAKRGGGFVASQSRISLQYAPSSRLASASFGWRIQAKPF